MQSSPAIFRSVFALLLVSTACDDKAGGAGASASAKPTEVTCDAAARGYGEGLAKAIAKQNAKLESQQGAITEAVVTSCKEDKWDEKTLSCLSGALDMQRRTGTDVTESCVKGLPADVQTKMDDRVKAKMGP